MKTGRISKSAQRNKTNKILQNKKINKKVITKSKPFISSNQKNKKQSLFILEKQIFKRFHLTYAKNSNVYNIKVINDIICNENSHLVSLFKEYLIYGDYSEFLQEYYSKDDIKEALPKLFEYYNICSVIFPNYTILPESKYIYSNIQYKQRIIDIQEELELKEEEKEKKKKESVVEDLPEPSVFDTNAVESILNLTDSSTIRKIMGINEEPLNTTISLDLNRIIEQIDKGEEYIQIAKKKESLKFSLRKKKPKIGNNINKTFYSNTFVKGRNIKTKIHTTKNSKSKIKIIPTETTSYNGNLTQHKHNNSISKKRGIIDILLSSKTDPNRKTSKDNPKQKNEPQLKKGQLKKKDTSIISNKVCFSSITSPKKEKKITKRNYNNIFSVPKISNQFINVITSYKTKNKNLSQKSEREINKNLIQTQDQMNNNCLVPLTTREKEMLTIGQEKVLKSKIKKIKSMKTSISNSNSHKKTFTSSSLITATGSSYINKIQQKDNIKVKESKQPKGKIPKKAREYIAVTHRNMSTGIESLGTNTFTIDNIKDSMLTQIQNKSKKMKKKKKFEQSFKKKNITVIVNNKEKKYKNHFQSNSSLGDSNNIKLKESNGSSPAEREQNIKGIKIKGFDKLVI